MPMLREYEPTYEPETLGTIELDPLRESEIIGLAVQTLNRDRKRGFSDLSVRKIIERDRSLGYAKQLVRDAKDRRPMRELLVSKFLDSCNPDEIWCILDTQISPGQTVVIVRSLAKVSPVDHK